MPSRNDSRLLTPARVATGLSVLVTALLALIAGGAATAEAAGCGDDGQHIYGLQTMNGARCGAATVISARLARRYSDSSDFHGNQSSVRITQRDANGKKYSCRWQSADSHREIINWACKRHRKLVLWVWREHPLNAP